MSVSRPTFASVRASHKARDKGDRKFVAALARGLAILRSFRPGDRYLSNQEMARRTGLPKPTVSRLAHTLKVTGFLSYSKHHDAYALDNGVLSLGHAYLSALNISETARPLMQKLADSTRATVALGEPQGWHMVVLEICHGNPTYRLYVNVGEKVQHSITALGRAFLASLNPQEREEKMSELAVCRPKEMTPAVCDNIKQSLREYDKHGFVFSCGDWTPDLFACGVPLVSRDGARPLTLSCSGPVFEMNRKRLINEIAPRVIELRDQVYAAAQGYF